MATHNDDRILGQRFDETEQPRCKFSGDFRIPHQRIGDESAHAQ